MEHEFTLQYLLFVTVVVCGISAVPLPNIISDSIKEMKFSSQGKTFLHGGNPDLPTPENTEEFNTPSVRRPSQAEVTGSTNEKLQNIEHSVSRSRRATGDTECVVSAGSPVVDVNPGDLEGVQLNVTTFLGANPIQLELPVVPANQPDVCPTKLSWLSRNEDNYRSTCPWKIVVKDLEQYYGKDVYPRYVKEAMCVCNYCVDNNVNICQEHREAVVVFQKIGCLKGLAVMMKRTVHITTACYCKRPVSNVSTGGGPNNLPQESE